MYSSDSEEDCYGNLAEKLQKMKNIYNEDKIETSNLLNDSHELDEIVEKNKAGTKKVGRNKKPHKNDATSSSENSDYANYMVRPRKSKKYFTRSSRRKTRGSNIPVPPPQPERTPERDPLELPTNNITLSDTNTSQNSQPRGRNNNTRGENSNSNFRGQNASRRGRGSRGISRSRRGRRGRPIWQTTRNITPLYSIGNTDEYYDQSNNQQLFTNKPTTSSDIIVIEDNDMPFDENEDLSIKVYWQSSEIYKFIIRRYQKLAQIFEYFSRKENVSTNKLLLTYNDKILKPEDSPDSINYSIGKFIEGGIVKDSIINLTYDEGEDIKNGITLKFQCQNMKKPLKLTAGLDDKFSIVMVKCAELLEKPLEKLIFEFDGDSISGNHTARQLDLEDGECIDVKIIS